MNQETSTQTRVLNSAFGRPPKGERRVRFADTMGMELVSIFLFELINEYFHNQDSRTRRHQLKLMSHSHNQPAPLKPTLSDSQYYSNRGSNLTSLNNNNNNKSEIRNNLYQTHNNNYNFGAGYHSTNHFEPSYNSYNNGTVSNTTTSSNLVDKSNTSQSSIESNAKTNTAARACEPSYICEFTQPISLLSFKERVKLNKVQLETCQVSSAAGHVSVSCTIRVLNLSYDKSVIVRYTTDDWRTHTDSLASYKPGSSDGWSDKFTSAFTLPNQAQGLKPGQRIIFAIRCLYDGSDTHWDNNGGLNYAIRMQQQH